MGRTVTNREDINQAGAAKQIDINAVATLSARLQERIDSRNYTDPDYYQLSGQV